MRPSKAAADQAAVSAVNSLSSSATAYTIEGKGGRSAGMGFVDGQNGVTVSVNDRPGLRVVERKLRVGRSDYQPHPAARCFRASSPRRFRHRWPCCGDYRWPRVRSSARSDGKKRARIRRQHDRHHAKVQLRLRLQRLEFLVGRGFGVSHGQCSNRRRRINATSGLVDNGNIKRLGDGAQSLCSALGSLEVVVGQQTRDSGASTVTLNPGWYKNGLHVAANQVVTLSPSV